MSRILLLLAVVLLVAIPALAQRTPVYIPAYYDCQLFTINFTEQPSMSEQAVILHNKSINIIYRSDPGLPGGQPFVSVLDAIQGDGFNPLWQEVQITFTAGHTPRQFCRDDDIVAAAQGIDPEITLTPTGEVYICSVVGGTR